MLDMAGIIRNLASRPTHVSELVQADEPIYIGYCDASRPKTPCTDCMAGPMAQGSHQRHHFRRQPTRDNHQFRSGNGGRSLAGSSSGGSPWPGDGGCSPCHRLRQLTCRRLDQTNGHTQHKPDCLSAFTRLCHAPKGDPVPPTNSISCRRHPQYPC
jgi:hypothetical protein